MRPGDGWKIQEIENYIDTEVVGNSKTTGAQFNVTSGWVFEKTQKEKLRKLYNRCNTENYTERLKELKKIATIDSLIVGNTRQY